MGASIFLRYFWVSVVEVSERFSVELSTAYERGTWFNKIRRLITSKNAPAIYSIQGRKEVSELPSVEMSIKLEHGLWSNKLRRPAASSSTTKYYARG